jgi:hypothetical protein
MTLSAERNTPRREVNRIAPLVSNAADGTAVAGGTAATGNVVGVAEETVTGDGVLTVKARFGCFQFFNSANADLISAKDIGQPCYVVDAATVALTDNAGARKVAGAIVDVDANGVWVQVGPGAVGVPLGAIANLNAWATALATKLNADAGVTDVNYDTNPQA